MFYDTSTLQYNEGGFHVDLTTPAGRLWFYGTIRNFWSQIPPPHRARIDGKPLVFLYASAFARRVDENLLPAVRAMFRRDFGTDLFLVKMQGWPGEADSEYQWGGALAPQFLDTAGLGPGYDHSAVPGRTPLVRPREDGQFYRRAWQRLLTKEVSSRPWLVHVETWNEFHEGTEVCETKEYGRLYIELTRRFADGVEPDRAGDLGVVWPGPPLAASEILDLTPGRTGDDVAQVLKSNLKIAPKNTQKASGKTCIYQRSNLLAGCSKTIQLTSQIKRTPVFCLIEIECSQREQRCTKRGAISSLISQLDSPGASLTHLRNRVTHIRLKDCLQCYLQR
mgnify:CR=1 FL=1